MKAAIETRTQLELTADIKYRIALAGLTLSEIDRIYHLTKGTARNTLRHPSSLGEVAIARELGVKPHTLWPSRYDNSGVRLLPQPMKNYDRPPTILQRRKLAEAQT